MNVQTVVALRSSSRIARWSGYIAGIFQRSTGTLPLGAPLPMTRRRELLLAQDLKRNEQRIRMLELLHEVKHAHGSGSIWKK